MTKFSSIAVLGPGFHKLESSQGRMEIQKTGNCCTVILILWRQSKRTQCN